MGRESISTVPRYFSWRHGGVSNLVIFERLPMSERRDAFSALQRALSGHFQANKQTRVSKTKLLELLYSRIGNEYGSFVELVDDYLKLHGNGDRQALSRALRRAVQCLDEWMQEYYASYPNHALQFELVDCCKLRANIVDGFEGRSLPSIVQEVDTLLTEVGQMVHHLRALFNAETTTRFADEFSDCMDSLHKDTCRLRKAQCALKRRA